MKKPLTVMACVFAAAAALGLAPKATAAGADVVVADSNLGVVIVDAKGTTAYVFDKDVPDQAPARALETAKSFGSLC
jgi:predicted lipoprotein with Yx(FWY)xxD motif